MNTQTIKNYKYIIFCGGVILTLSLGIRHSFGMFMMPMISDFHWGREVFGFGIALQNLMWGLAQPITGRIADKYGAGKVILAGGALYAIGLLLMALTTSTTEFTISAGLLIGLGLSGTTFPIVFGVVSRSVSPEKRSMAMGVCMSLGSLGQFVLLPGSVGLIDGLGWSGALIAMAFLSLLIFPLAVPLMEKKNATETKAPEPEMKLKEILSEAFYSKAFWMLCGGFFVCGFHIVFIAVHLPIYLVDSGLTALDGSIVLGLIGLGNILGSYYAGLWGGKYPKAKLLSALYFGRALLFLLFIMLPMSQITAYVFGFIMGFLWLSTVPLTNGAIATIFGVKNLSMLGGFVFLAHQVGAFLGGWLGGKMYDLVGSYDSVWIISIGLGIMAALINLPIKEVPIDRTAHATA
ncbi:MFS transporter [Polynucleobacter sp. AM-26B4]|uniref:MFS transporter n=1 Tax=Polynucleobacter sp. AM-26B4 TaxID=2689103 RepID=UPI001C0CF88F|nr:MFS transporter [Polynucleobacter sp. AM-26B4]MBU3585433.1 MFS transporter [Polynucleobacter sp. AM-26B4]